MKKIFFLGIILFFSCKNEIVEKPKNLIDEETMVDILYDLSMIQAIKGNDVKTLPLNQIDPKKYVYVKYKIDSLQLVKSNKYYASDVVNYKKMYDLALERIQNEKKMEEASQKKVK